MNAKLTFAKKVLWAIDPFHEDAQIQLQAGKSIQLLFKESPLKLQPVSVLSLGRFNPETFSFPDKWSDVAREARGNLDRLLNKAKWVHLEVPHLVQQEGSGITNAVETLLSYALEENAELILVSSHARKGAKRLLLGSFAETLALHSPLPVLVINPNVQPRERLKQIIFPTDFSETSKEAFNRVLKLAKELSCKVLLFHKIETIHPSLGYPFVLPPVSTDSLKEVAHRFEEVGNSWVENARKGGLEVKFYLKNAPGFTLDEILRLAKRGGGSTLIAMASQSGPLKTVLLGSLTRQVLRQANCPVLVIHPHQEHLATKFVGQVKNTLYSLSSRPVMS